MRNGGQGELAEALNQYFLDMSELRVDDRAGRRRLQDAFFGRHGMSVPEIAPGVALAMLERRKQQQERYRR